MTEIDASTGTVVRTLAGGNSVTGFDAATGAWKWTLPGDLYHLGTPNAIAVDGAHAWIANGTGGKRGNGSVTELAL